MLLNAMYGGRTVALDGLVILDAAVALIRRHFVKLEILGRGIDQRWQ